MGVTAYSKIFVGFPVTEADFIDTTIAAVATCPEGHSQPKDLEGDFCPKDGGKFAKRKTRRATTALKALHTFFEFEYDKDADADSNYTDMFSDDEPLCSLENYHWGRNAEILVVAGVRLSQVIHDEGSLGTMHLEKFREAFAEVEKLRKALKMTDRPISIFHDVRLT